MRESRNSSRSYSNACIRSGAYKYCLAQIRAGRPARLYLFARSDTGSVSRCPASARPDCLRPERHTPAHGGGQPVAAIFRLVDIVAPDRSPCTLPVHRNGNARHQRIIEHIVHSVQRLASINVERRFECCDAEYVSFCHHALVDFHRRSYSVARFVAAVRYRFAHIYRILFPAHIAFI
jgi:hypothetical protein